MTAVEPIPEAWPEALNARFTPHRQLGRGSFGTVFEATDRARGARVAVKVLRADRLHALQAFKREFRALADLAHAHLVPLHELGREGDTWFLVMEPIDGLDLLDALRASPHLLRQVFAQIALGLAFLHSSGRLHRDLKPSNVRVTPQGDAVVLDFGLAVDEAPDEAEGMVGAAAWLSPEQASGAPASAASDLYALGVMLFEALTGRRPFVGAALEVLAAKRSTDVVLPLPGVEASLCQRLLARTPADRPTAAEVVRTLEPALAPLLEQRPDVPLIGRREVLTRLERAQGPAAMWLHGPPGMGKSSVLRHFVRQRRDEGALVLTSRCFEHESTPFRTVDGLVDGLARWLATESTPLETEVANLARSFPVLRPLVRAAPSDSPPERHRHESAIALRHLIHAATQRQPVVVAIDDLHWADADSIPFLRELLDTPTTAPVVFVLALRDEGHPLLEPLRRAPAPVGCATRYDLPLGPLSADESLELLAALQPEAVERPRLAAGAHGNPFLLQALAGHDDLDAALASRLAHLPSPARHLLETVCLAKAPLPRAACATAANLTQAEALALGHLRAGRLVLVRGDGTIEPYHDTLRRAVERTIGPTEALARHASIADALARFDGDPELLAAHLHASNQLDAAADQALRGAHRAMSTLAYNHAADLFSKVLAWAPGRADAHAVRLALGTALSNAGRGADAAEVLLVAARAAPATEALELKTRAGAQLLRAGHVERGLDLTRTALKARGLSLARSPQGAFASMVWTRARLKLRGYEFVRRPASAIDRAELARIDTLTSTSIGLAALDSLRASDLMSQALLRALDAGEPTRIAVCLGYETAFSANAGGAGEARTREVLARCEAVTSTIDDAYAHACTFGGAGIASFHLGRLAEAQKLCEQAAQRFAKCPGAVKETFTSELFAMVALGHAGDLGEVNRRLHSALPAARERGDRYVEATLRTGLPNLSWLALDDERRARDEVLAAQPGLNAVSYSVQHFFEFMARLNIELYTNGKPLEVLDESLPLLDRSLLSRSEWIAIYRPWMVGRALLATKRHGRVLAQANAIEKKRRTWGYALALGLRAGAQVLEGDRPGAQQLLDRAATLADHAELALYATCCRLVLGHLRRDTTAVEQAHQRARGLGVNDLEKFRRVYLPATLP
ncbi:MAG: serine/threonine-protein kinase PknK [Archangiaceae bacterium]|nr:serine/threonine-protein kinase PknK [Archangiaceae bacterium]